MISSIEFNGYTFDQETATVQDMYGLGLPDISNTEAEKSQEDGVSPTGFRLRGRTFGWNGYLKAETPALYLAERQSLIGSLMPNGISGDEMIINLITGDTRTIRLTKILNNNFDFNQGEPSRTWNNYSVVFRSAFPYLEGDLTEAEQQITDFDTGVVVPAPVPSPLTGLAVPATSTDPLVVMNNGNANAYPVFIIVGPGTDFTVTNSTTGKNFTVSLTLTAGETLEIDTWNKTVTKSDGTNQREYFLGDYIKIAPGNNTLSFSATSGTTSDTILKTIFKDSYLNL